MSETTDATLLFVDDEPSILRTLQRLFIPLGYDVLTASSGGEGLSILEDNHVDVIVSDMRMPEMDGAAFLKQAAEKWPKTKRLLLTGYADIESAISAINDGKIDYYLSKPWKENQLEMVVEKCLESKRLKEKNIQLEEQVLAQNEELKQLNSSLEEKVVKRTAEVKKAYDSLQQSYQSSIDVLSTLVEMHEGDNKGHCRGIAKMTKAIAEALELPENKIQDIYFASLLHNIGKIGFSRTMLAKPFTQLTPEEARLYQRYPLLGEAALMAFEPLKEVANLIVSHREYIDGSGYPNKKTAQDIPMGAQIIAITVDYTELQLGLLAKEKLTAKQALEYIKAKANRNYTEDLITVFEQVISAMPEQQDNLNELIIPAEGLTEDMVLAKDLITDAGILLLPKGQALTPEHIAKIKQLDNLMIYIQSPD